MSSSIIGRDHVTQARNSPSECAVSGGACRLCGDEVAIAVHEESVRMRPAVRGACEILGLDPLHIANDGKLVAIVLPDEADAPLAAVRAHRLGVDAARIGTVLSEPLGMVLLRTGIGGSRVLDMLVGDPLPRIC